MKKLSVRNAIFQHVQTLKTNRKKRNQYHEFVIEGVRNINEAVKNGWNIKSFFCIEGEVSEWAKNLLCTVKTECNYCVSENLMRLIALPIEETWEQSCVPVIPLEWMLCLSLDIP